jgi:ABC-type antimicrobial peptide transport system permease subunit
LGGREFTEADNAAAPHVAIVNQEFVRKFYDGKSALGRHFRIGNDPSMEIVGVVKNSAYAAVKQEMYPLYFQAWRQDKQIGELSFYVRSALPVEQILPQIRRAVHNIDAALPVEGLRTLDEQISSNVHTDRLILQLSGGFAALATLLAMLGLYGVMAFSVARRTREIGSRVALGAAPGRIHFLVMRQMMTILVIGLVIGVPVALSVSKYTKSQLFGVQSFDWPTLIASVCALAIAAAAAGMIPARRAARLDPAGILRSE